MHACANANIYNILYCNIVANINLRYLYKSKISENKKHPSHKLGYKNIEKNKQLLYNYVLDLPRIPVTNQDFVGILDPEKTFTFTTMAEAPHC